MTTYRTRFEAGIEKRQAVRDAEGRGDIADSMDVRLALLARMKAGELTLEQVQAELKRIKRGAKSVGKITRAKAFSNG